MSVTEQPRVTDRPAGLSRLGQAAGAVYVAGRWQGAVSSGTFAVHDPATGDTIGLAYEVDRLPEPIG